MLVCVSRFSFPLPLLDHVPVVVAAAGVFPFPLSDRVLVALGGKDVMVTKTLIEDVLTLLMLIIKDCWRK